MDRETKRKIAIFIALSPILFLFIAYLPLEYEGIEHIRKYAVLYSAFGGVMAMIALLYYLEKGEETSIDDLLDRNNNMFYPIVDESITIENKSISEVFATCEMWLTGIKAKNIEVNPPNRIVSSHSGDTDDYAPEFMPKIIEINLSEEIDGVKLNIIMIQPYKKGPLDDFKKRKMYWPKLVENLYSYFGLDFYSPDIRDMEDIELLEKRYRDRKKELYSIIIIGIGFSLFAVYIRNLVYLMIALFCFSIKAYREYQKMKEIKNKLIHDSRL